MASLSSSWRRRWASTPARAAWLPGGRYAPCSRVRGRRFAVEIGSCYSLDEDQKIFPVLQCKHQTLCSAGIGVASQIVVTYLNIYYIVVLAWAIFYLFNSFKSPVPWSTCDNWWNTGEACADSPSALAPKKAHVKVQSLLFSGTPSDSCHNYADVFSNPHLYQPNSSWAFLNNFTADYSEDYDMSVECSWPSLRNSHGSISCECVAGSNCLWKLLAVAWTHVSFSTVRHLLLWLQRKGW